MKILIIKGDKFQAEDVAHDHGVSFTLMFESEGRRETVGHTSAHEDVLNRWFCEHNDAPYPVGTLLYWGEKPVKKIPISPQDYVLLRGVRCPACGSDDIEGKNVEIDAGSAGQEMTCTTCNSRWEDNYILTGYVNLEERDKK